MDPEEKNHYKFIYSRNTPFSFRFVGVFVVLIMFAAIPLVVITINQQTNESSHASVLAATTSPTGTADAASYASISLVSPAISTSGGNTQPLHGARLVTIKLYNVDTQNTYTAQDTLTFDGVQSFNNPHFNLGSIPSGTYQLLINMPGHLQKSLTQTNNTNTFPIQAGSTIVVPAARLIPGDIGPIPGTNNQPYGDNVLDIEDYNVLIGCYSDTQAASSCSDVAKTAADLNDDGKVDAVDYNILLRSFATRDGDSLPILSSVTGSVTPTPTCVQEPACLLSNPPTCVISQPSQGWCPATGTPTPSGTAPTVTTILTATPTVTGNPTGALTISNLKVYDSANASNWALRPTFDNGDTQYGDRTYTISNVPSALAGAQWIRTANSSKSFTGNPMVTFTISRSATVYVGMDNRGTAPSWIDSTWSDSGMQYTNSEPMHFKIYQKTFPAGTVSLGRNATQTYAIDTYSVIIK